MIFFRQIYTIIWPSSDDTKEEWVRSACSRNAEEVEKTQELFAPEGLERIRTGVLEAAKRAGGSA